MHRRWIFAPPIFASLMLAASLPSASDPPATAGLAGGTYVDHSGTKHAWSITAAHALLWDNAPYVPVGGRFYPASLSSDTQASWDRDTATINELKSKGIRDLIIVPDLSLPDASPVRMQRLIDLLDADGFNYGIAFGKGVPEPLTGTVVKPASYHAYTDESLTAAWQTPYADSGVVALVEATSGHNEVVKVTTEKIADNNLTIAVEAPPTSGKVAPFLYPHKIVPSGTRGSLPDLWTGFDGYRDRLLAFFANVKPGKGFRFFLDPLGADISLADETDYLVPDSPAFLLEWEGYIRSKYPTVDLAYHDWGLEEASTLTHKELARLLPMFVNDVAIPYMYDPVHRKSMRMADVIQSRWWSDFLTFRNNSIAYYMNSISNVLKRQVADVPVVYDWTMNHPIFMNKLAAGGFDGLGIVANRRGARLINRIAAPAFSEAAQCAHRVWCVETGAGPELDPDPTIAETSSPGIPFPTQGAIIGEINDLRHAGVKGFFPGAFHDDAANTGRNDWLKTPNSVDWLRDAQSTLAADLRAADYSPSVLPYPIATPGPAIIGPIGNSGVSWLPTFETGTAIDWWPSISGYSLNISSREHPDIVLVSLTGRREVHFFVVDAKQVTARTFNGASLPVKVLRKSMFSVVFPDRNPVIFSTGGQDLTPVEAAEDANKQLEALYSYATALKSPDINGVKVSLTEAHLEYLKGNFGMSNSAARRGIETLIDTTEPYIWIEGENFSLSTFDDAPPLSGASRDRYLRVSNYNNPPHEYAVHYPLNIVAKGRYNIWMACTPPAADVSPIQWAVGDYQRRDPADPKPQGPLYSNDKFGWILLGTANFDNPGNNTLAIYVTGRAPATGRYSFGIDAIFLTTASDPPYGPFMPMPIDLSAVERHGKR